MFVDVDREVVRSIYMIFGVTYFIKQAIMRIQILQEYASLNNFTK